jgi:hypothetical protein
MTVMDLGRAGAVTAPAQVARGTLGTRIGGALLVVLVLVLAAGPTCSDAACRSG